MTRAQRLRDVLRPRRLLRVRSSTWVLLAIFLVALAAWTYVKPPSPTSNQSGNTQTGTVHPSSTPEPTRTASPTRSPTANPTATPSRTTPKGATPTAAGSPPATPAATADPSPSAFGSPG